MFGTMIVSHSKYSQALMNISVAGMMTSARSFLYLKSLYICDMTTKTMAKAFRASM